MSLIQHYSDDVREECASTPLSLADEVKLSKESFNLVIENIKKQLELSDEEAKASFENLSDDLDDIENSFPSLESFDDDLIPCVSEEDFKQRVLYAYDMLIKWLKKIARWLKETFDTLTIRIIVLKERLSQLRIDSLQTRFNNTGTFTFSSNVQAISLRYQPVKTVGELTAALSSLADHLDAYYSYMKTFTDTNSSRVIEELSTGEQSEAELVEMMVAVSPLSVIGKMKLVEAKDVPNASTTMPLLNNIRLLLVAPKNINSLVDVNAIDLKVARAMSQSGKVPNKVTIPHFDRRTSDRCLEQMNRVTGIVENGVTGQPRKVHRKVVNDIERMRARLQREMRSNESDGMIYQRIAATRTLVDWLTQPYRSLAVNSIRTVNGSYQLCRQNMRGSD